MDYDTDHELMERIAHKDTLAYRQLVSRHLDFCVRFSERMLGNRADAEDIAQDTCLKIWNEAPRWQPRAKFTTWLYRVLMNACLDHRRKVVPFSAVEMENIVDEQPGADTVLMQRQSAQQVRSALAELPERQRAAVILSYYEQVSNQDAADVLSMQLGAFQQLLFRARATLKERLMDVRLEQKNG